jgi:hypothetical protein
LATSGEIELTIDKGSGTREYISKFAARHPRYCDVGLLKLQRCHPRVVRHYLLITIDF